MLVGIVFYVLASMTECTSCQQGRTSSLEANNMHTTPSRPITEDQSLIVARHYLIACAWADAEEGTSPRPTRQSLAVAQKLAQEFAQQIGPEALQMTLDAYTSARLHHDCHGSPFAAFGHDLYLTLEGHGAGFWDRDALCIKPPAHDFGEDVQTLGDWLTRQCASSRWECAHSSGLIEFHHGWIYFREPNT